MKKSEFQLEFGLIALKFGDSVEPNSCAIFAINAFASSMEYADFNSPKIAYGFLTPFTV